MKWIKYFLLFIVALVLLLSIGGFFFYQGLKPDYDGNKQLQNLNAPSRVVFDNHAIPHIYAENDLDAFRTLGYVHASERLFQMDLMRRVGGGRLSELFGKDLKEADELFRTLGLNKIAIESADHFFKDADEEYKQLTLAYLDGINQYIEDGDLPFEYSLLGNAPKKFEPVDLYRTVAYMGFSFALAFKSEPIADYIQRNLGNEYLNDLALHTLPQNTQIPVTNSTQKVNEEPITAFMRNISEVLPTPEFTGSNAWIVGAERSKSGKVLFANDTHIGYSQPCVWYEAHISTPNLKLYGNFLAGFPFPLIGHTDHHAWGLTMLQNDDFDLYRETVEGNKVMYKGEWTALEKRTETIQVKDEGEYSFEVYETPHGPLINKVVKGLAENDQISAFWSMTKFPMDVLTVGHGLAYAKSMDEFESAISHLVAPGLNVMYADKDDNIAWWGTAKLLDRPAHVDSKLILDGASGNDDPNGYLPWSKNPRSVNPESGYVYSANNQPAAVDSTLYPGYYYSGNRAKTIMKTLDKAENWTIEDMKKLQLHNKSESYPTNVSYISSLISTDSEIEAQALVILKNWNGEHSLTNVGPTIYYKLLYNVLEKCMADELGKENFESYIKSFFMLRSNSVLLANDSTVWWDNINTKDQIESRQDIVQAAFEKSIEELSVQLTDNTANWTWEKVHRLTHEHPIGKVEPMDQIFNVGNFAIDGGEEVLNKQSFVLNGDGIYKVKGGPAMRIVIDFSEIEKSESVLPTGESGNPFSPYYQDQAKMFNAGEYRAQLMNKEDIDKVSIGTIEFKPE